MRSLCKPLSVNRSESRRSLSLRQPNRSAIVVFLILLCAAATAFADDEARRLVALLDYLGSDYKNAVQDGKIVNPNEFAEMQEFSKRTLELFKQLKETDKADKAGIEPSLKSLARSDREQGRPQSGGGTCQRCQTKAASRLTISSPIPNSFRLWRAAKQFI